MPLYVAFYVNSCLSTNQMPHFLSFVYPVCPKVGPQSCLFFSYFFFAVVPDVSRSPMLVLPPVSALLAMAVLQVEYQLSVAECHDDVLCIPKKMLSAVSSKSPPERGHSTLHVVLERKKADIVQGNKGTCLKG